MLLPTKLILSCSLFSHWVVSESSPPHELQHTKLACLSLLPRVCLNFCPLSWWCHLTISSSVAPFSSSPQSFPASKFSPVSQLCVSGVQSTGASASSSFLPMNIHGWFPLGSTGLSSLQCKRLSRVFLLQYHNLKELILQCSAFFMVQLSCPYMSTGKTIAFAVQTSVGKVISLLLNTLSRFVMLFF